jgi:hypothetical protein
MNIAAPFLCPYSIKPSRDDGERGVLAVTAFKIAGREMHLHQESAAPGRSRATRKEHDGKGKTKAEFRRSLGAAGSLLRNPRAPSDGQRQRPVCGFAKPCVSVPGIHPGKLTGVSAPF